MFLHACFLKPHGDLLLRESSLPFLRLFANLPFHCLAPQFPLFCLHPLLKVFIKILWILLLLPFQASPHRHFLVHKPTHESTQGSATSHGGASSTDSEMHIFNPQSPLPAHGAASDVQGAAMPVPHTVQGCAQPSSVPGKENQSFPQSTLSPLQDAALCMYLLTTSQYFSTPSPCSSFLSSSPAFVLGSN